MKILIPKGYTKIDPGYGPLFFLVGPVRGGGDWQKKCTELIRQRIEHFYVAIPYYHGDRADFPLVDQAEVPEVTDYFPRQRDWEAYYIKQAMQKGCLISWMAAESKTKPRPGGHYGNDSLGEAARYSVHRAYNPTWNLAFGGEEGFYSFDLMRRNFIEDHNGELPVHRTLEDLVDDAVQLALST